MWPDLAARIIRDHSQSGDVIVDPMCGSGTTVLEAIHAGRDAGGIDEYGRAELARANITHAHTQSAAGHAIVEHRDADTPAPSSYLRTKTSSSSPDHRSRKT